MLDDNVRENRLRILEETRNIYYGPNWEPLRTRAMDSSGTCIYKSNDGRMCAAGRLAPDAEWVEFDSVDEGSNESIAIEVCERHGIHSGNDDESVRWLERLQHLHDSLQDPARIYGCMKDALQQNAAAMS